MKEIRNQARKLMEGFCRACPICDGRACAGEVPGMGGIGTGAAFRDNILALSEFRFQMRVIHDVVEPDTRTQILGIPLEIPVLAAPIGGDMLKMLALGADAVMIGRPFSVAVMGGLKEGAMCFIDQIRSELIQAMILTGSKSVDAVEPSILWMKP